MKARNRGCLGRAALALTVTLGVGGTWATDVGGLICEDTTWDCAHSPYVVVNSILVACDATLTIEPCVEVRFKHGMTMTIGSGSLGSGTLVARGTAALPILCTSNDPYDPNDPNDPNNNNLAEPGDWGRLYFTTYAMDAVFADPNDPNSAYVSGSIIEYLTLEFAGNNNVSAVTIESAAPYVSHCHIHHNIYRGVKVTGISGMRIEDCEINHNSGNQPGAGLYLTDGTGHRLRGNAIHHNVTTSGHGGGVYMYAQGQVLGSAIHYNVTSGYGGGVYMYGGGQVSGNVIEYNMGSTGAGSYLLTIAGGLTVDGNVFRGNTTSGGGGGLYVYKAYASPNCTITNNTIVGNFANNANGGGLYLAYGQGVCRLESNVIEDNHTTGNGTAGGGIYFLTVQNWSVRDNVVRGNTCVAEGAGVYFDHYSSCSFRGNAVIDNCTTNGQTGGMFITGAGGLTMEGDPAEDWYNTICGNCGYQVWLDLPFNANGSNDINARYVRWCADDPNEIEEGIYDYFDNPAKAIVIMYPFVGLVPGDMNCDDLVDFDDINPFVLAVGDPGAYTDEYPHCCLEHADCNADGVVNFDDINPFIDILSGGS